MPNTQLRPWHTPGSVQQLDGVGFPICHAMPQPTWGALPYRCHFTNHLPWAFMYTRCHAPCKGKNVDAYHLATFLPRLFHCRALVCGRGYCTQDTASQSRAREGIFVKTGTSSLKRGRPRLLYVSSYQNMIPIRPDDSIPPSRESFFVSR